MYRFKQISMSTNDLIPIGEAAKILGVSIQTLRRWDKNGKLSSIKTPGGRRRYKLENLNSGKIFQIAQLWATEKNPKTLPDDYYCDNRAVFETRLQNLSRLLKSNTNGSLIISATGEIGNNSFDHNLGNWPDIPGIFFGFDLTLGIVVLADRGLGILTTLQRVKPELYLHSDALQTAFTEVITGRAPEKRGNGLKFVKKIVQKEAAGLFFQTGNALLNMDSGSDTFKITNTENHARGTLAQIKFKT
ncbi:MAG: hypothetical protein UX09_C0050G0006 [Candidatus Uhrbacteria bacterium GW2011_GWE2_45_35]|uniref:HTH merR-type domain-containing protein n=1 Tax=Candidatus Uhrbacteria bacterium GW2011_GWE2_45_35 TaxID=1618993 RepID=A0A0G1MEH8_9BACT|nr:MAG: hypothetical protein UX09_C0050G0006 [Candidatus Uhrbacteria bacterium GW2011_GWE2_45_35]